jgi:Phosphotransferase enzyme family
MAANLRGLRMNETRLAFAMFMDTSQMKSLFQQELPDCLSGTWKLTDCQIQHPRYKTYLNPKSRDKSFLALAYHLNGINIQTQKTDDRILYVKVYLGSRSHNEFEKARSETALPRQDSVLHFVKYKMVGWFFPYDPALPWLPKVLAEEEIKPYFSDSLLAQSNGLSWTIKDIAFTVINYRPEIRCTCRYDIHDYTGNALTLYGKTFSDERGAEIYRRLSYLYGRAKNNLESFVIARPLGYDSALHTVWLDGLNGESLLGSINEQNCDELMVRLAKHLADFHNVTLNGLDDLTEEDQLAEIQKKSVKLQVAFPCLANRIEDILTSLKQEISGNPLSSLRLIHGDFHIEQLLLLEDNRLALFDFDELAVANPLVDLANFAAALYTLGLGKRLTEKLISQLFNTYKASSASETAINDKHFDWHLRVQFLTRAYRAYIQRKPNLEQLIQQFIDAAEIGYVTNKD